MTLIEAKAAEQTATKQLADAQREVIDAEKRLGDAQKDCDKATATVCAADPDSSGFIDRISAKALAEHRVMALEDFLKRARATLAEAKTRGESAAMAAMQAELNDLGVTLASVDSGLIEYLDEAREEARGRLANLEQLLNRANAIDQEMSRRRGEPFEAWRWPRHYQTLTAFLTVSAERNILQFLERVIDDPEFQRRRA